MRISGLLMVTQLGLLGTLLPVWSQGIDKRVAEAEARRLAVVDKITPAVVAIFSADGQGGGSGVLIDKDGYALTNFHVVEGAGPVMHCGLPDGVLYDGVLVGLDKVGDVALIKLLPQKPGQAFPCAVMGDSDKLKAGEWSLALGNPFLLATNFHPTVTYGLISGVHRYQYPAGTLLEYTDCIQVDTSINPGNSGGPLFNMEGELVGINGRGSFEKRGRVNSGAGYAISINQIKNFLGHLHAGLDADHATLGATIKSDSEEGDSGRLLVEAIIEDCDARRRGLDVNDELVSFAGRPMTSVNQYKNVLGLFPKGWRVPLVYRRNNEKHEILVRLMQLQQTQASADAGKPKAPPGILPKAPTRKSPASAFYEPKPGFANYYFNKIERDRLLAAFKAHGDFSKVTGSWKIEGQGAGARAKGILRVTIQDEPRTTAAITTPVKTASAPKAGDANSKTMVHLLLGGIKFDLEPLKLEQAIDNLKQPNGSGGMLTALYHYRRLLTLGPAGFEGYCHHNGFEPFYPLPTAGRPVDSLKDLRVDTEVLLTEHAAVPGKWYFSRHDHMLVGFEIWMSPDEDPCEVYLSDYRPVDGRLLPHRWEVRYGNDSFGIFELASFQLVSAK